MSCLRFSLCLMLFASFTFSFQTSVAAEPSYRESCNAIELAFQKLCPMALATPVPTPKVVAPLPKGKKPQMIPLDKNKKVIAGPPQKRQQCVLADKKAIGEALQLIESAPEYKDEDIKKMTSFFENPKVTQEDIGTYERLNKANCWDAKMIYIWQTVLISLKREDKESMEKAVQTLKKKAKAKYFSGESSFLADKIKVILQANDYGLITLPPAAVRGFQSLTADIKRSSAGKSARYASFISIDRQSGTAQPVINITGMREFLRDVRDETNRFGDQYDRLVNANLK